MFNPSIIPTDSDDAHTVLNVIDSLKEFQNASEAIFQRLQNKLFSQQRRLQNFTERTLVLEKKIECLRNCVELPVLSSSARYPNVMDAGMHECVFEQLVTSTPFLTYNFDNEQAASSISSRRSALNAVDVAAQVIARKAHYEYVFAKPKFLEAERSKIRESNIYPYVTVADENRSSQLYNKAQQGKTIVCEEQFESLLSYCEFGDVLCASDPFSYQPDAAGKIGDFDFPSVLPNLPDSKSTFGGIDDSFFAPISISKANSLIQKTSIVDLSAPQSFYVSAKKENLRNFSEDEMGLLARKNGQYNSSSSPNASLSRTNFFTTLPDEISTLDLRHTPTSSSNLGVIFAVDDDKFESKYNDIQKSNDDNISLFHNGLPLNNAIKNVPTYINNYQNSLNYNSLHQLSSDTQSSFAQVSQPNSSLAIPSSLPPAPPQPPPPPPPPLNVLLKNDVSTSSKLPVDVSKGHADLMQAIRAAGGTDNARLKKITTSDEAALSNQAVNKKLKSSENAGDDLMSSLAKALEIRRRGISGSSVSKKFASFENKPYNSVGSVDKESSGDISVMGAFSRLRQIIPITSASGSAQKERSSANLISNNTSDDDDEDTDDWN